jgi:cell volume regulation protein A
LLATAVFPRLPAEAGGFAPVASVATAALAFGSAEVVGGSGFLAVYLAGLALGSTPTRFRRQLVAFHQGAAFLAQVVMFVVLGLLVFPSELDEVAVESLLLAGLLMVVIRPVAVWLCTVGFGLTVRERVLVGWTGLRGAAPIVIGTFVLSSGIDDADRIFNVVFFVVVVSTLLQGTTLEWLAARLRLVTAHQGPVQAPLEIAGSVELDLVEFDVTPEHSIDGAFVRELGLPRRALVAVVLRGDEEIPPRGSTVVRAGDRLYVLVPHAARADLDDTFARWRQRI